MPPADVASPDSDSPFQRGDDDPKVQAFRLRLVERDVKEIKRMVIELHSKQSNQQPCPSPGLCVKLEKRVEDLEENRAEQEGAWKALVIIGSVVSSALTFVGIKVFWK